ncbi:MAG: magnesium transporter [Candidatus Thermoplasmatota archaeon]|nr:magnesium transporter [Candidatus Thermoplasmatota archaeon]
MHSMAMVKQSLPLLITCGIGGIIAGSTLSVMSEILENIPGLIVVIPAIIALRGNISTALGSRLGSAYHLGVIGAENMWNPELRQNILGSLVLSFLVSILIGIIAYVTTVLFFKMHPDPFKLLSIVILAGIISAFILTILTITIIYLVFKRGYDPDNITGPALATFGDIVTMFCVFGSSIIVEVII